MTAWKPLETAPKYNRRIFGRCEDHVIREIEWATEKLSDGKLHSFWRDADGFPGRKLAIEWFELGDAVKIALFANEGRIW